MSKADRFTKRFQEKLQRNMILNPSKNRPLSKTVNYYDIAFEIERGSKFVDNLMKNKRR